MFFDNESFNKYSLYGRFENQLTLSDLKSKTDDIETTKFLEECKCMKTFIFNSQWPH
jgi:hypothetical protein